METDDQDVVMMKGGKLMMRRNGLIAPMQEEIAIFDGMRVMMDGTVMLADGIARMIMEGEALTMDGRITSLDDLERGTPPRRTGRSVLLHLLRRSLRLPGLGFFRRHSGD